MFSFFSGVGISWDTAKVPSVVGGEDNETLRDQLVLHLSEEGFAVRGVGGGQELNEAIEALLHLHATGEAAGFDHSQALHRALSADCADGQEGTALAI